MMVLVRSLYNYAFTSDPKAITPSQIHSYSCSRTVSPDF